MALVLVPQSMAYAQLAGLPPYYGLYAAFLPVAVAALWGSSNQLGTGPVAVASLLTASSLAPLAAPGSEQFVALAIMLALMVGVVQLALGVFKLGVVVNFLSHPVIVGFTNAAAMIIGLSQVNKLIGVPMGRSESFHQRHLGRAKLVGDTHLPTLAMGVAAIAIMWVIRKKAPKLPGVLIAVAVTTVVSWQIGFERNATATLEQIAEPEAQTLLAEFVRTEARIKEITEQIAAKAAELKKLQKAGGDVGHDAATLHYEIELLKLQLKDREDENRRRNRAVRSFVFEQVAGADGQPAQFYAQGKLPAGRSVRRPPLAHRQGRQRQPQAHRRRRGGRQDSRGPALDRHAEVFLGHDRQPAFRRHRHLAGRLHGGDFHRQGHRRQDQGQDRPEPGTDRPGPGQHRRQPDPGLPGVRFLLALGGEHQCRGQDRHVLGDHRRSSCC